MLNSFRNHRALTGHRARQALCCLALLALALLITPATSMAADQKKVRSSSAYIVVVNNAPPFRIIDEWGGKTGYAGAYIDTINEISSRTKIPLTFLNVSFSRALAMMKNGAADMMLGPTWNVDRADYMYYLSATFPAETKVFYLAEKIKDVARYSDLNGLRIGILQSARYFERFDNDTALNKVPLNQYETGFKLLDRGRIDVILIPERQGKFLQRAYGYNFRTSSFRIPGSPSFVTIAHKSGLIKRKDEIEQVMKELKEEGFFERLMTVYLQ